MNKQLTAKAPQYSLVFFNKKHPHQFDWNTKNRNDQAFLWICSLSRADKSVRSSTDETQSQSRFPPLLSLLSLGDQLLGLQLHLRRPFKGHIHQELETAEVLCEVWGGGGRGVEQPATGAQVALHAGAAEDGGGGGERLAAWPVIPAFEQRLRGLQELSSPVTVHSRHRGVGGCWAGLHRRGDSGVTDDRGTSGHEARRGGR